MENRKYFPKRERARLGRNGVDFGRRMK